MPSVHNWRAPSSTAVIEDSALDVGSSEAVVGDGQNASIDSVAPSTAHRVASSLAALGLLGPAFAIWSGIIDLPWAGVVAVVSSLGAMVLLAGAASCRRRRTLVRIDVALLVLALAALGAWSAVQLRTYPTYGTDEAAYVQYAAQLWLHGADPYKANLLRALNIFGVPIQYATYTLSGGISSALGYPAFAVVFTAPFVLMTHGVQSVIIADVIAMAIGMVTVFCVLPRQWRALAVVVVLDYPILFGYTVSGSLAIFLLPLLALAAWRWTEVGRGGRLRARGWVNSAAMGLAISVQQIAWFVGPFVVVGIFIARRREVGTRGALRVVTRYCAVAAAAFVAVNAPFILSGPVAFLRGIMVPLTQHAIPYGQGLIDLADFAGIGGGSLHLYTDGAMLGMIGLLVVFAWRFDVLWRAAFILPSLAMWFPSRSLAEYWMTLVAVWVVSIVAANPPLQGGNPARSGHRPPFWAVSFALLPALAVLGLAVASPSPLSLQILRVRTNGQMGKVWSADVRVVNHSDRSLVPHYAIDSVGQMTSFWQLVKGPARIPAHRSAEVTLDAPNVGSMPGIVTRFQMEAVTASPETVSVGSRYTAEPYTLQMASNYFAPQKLGEPLRIRVQLESQFGAAAHVAGVRVQLGQVVYAQDGLLGGTASIDGRPEGKSPVSSPTNGGGVATFTVTGRQASAEPDYFQAWIAPESNPRRPPSGYSQVVSVRFVRP